MNPMPFNPQNTYPGLPNSRPRINGAVRRQQALFSLPEASLPPRILFSHFDHPRLSCFFHPAPRGAPPSGLDSFASLSPCLTRRGTCCKYLLGSSARPPLLPLLNTPDFPKSESQSYTLSSTALNRLPHSTSLNCLFSLQQHSEFLHSTSLW